LQYRAIGLIFLGTVLIDLTGLFTPLNGIAGEAGCILALLYWGAIPLVHPTARGEGLNKTLNNSSA